MIRWKPIAAASGIVAAALLLTILGARQELGVSANDNAKRAASDGPGSSEFSPPPSPPMVTVSAGTRLYVRLEDAISTDKNSSGDPLSASLDAALMVDGKVLAPSRSKVLGQLTKVQESGRVKGRSSLTMILENLIVDGKEYDLQTDPLTVAVRSAVIGAGVGGGSGTGYSPGAKGVPVDYGVEAHFAFTLSSPLELPVYRQ